MLAVIAALIGLLVLALAVPVDMSFRVRGIEAFAGQIRVRWLFGLVRFRVDFPSVDMSPTAEPERELATEKSRPPRDGDRARTNLLAVLRRSAFRRRSYRLIKDLARAAHLQQLGLRLRLGLGDPADTGRLWALMGPISAAAQDLRNAEVRIDPEFMDAVFEFDAHGRVAADPGATGRAGRIVCAFPAFNPGVAHAARRSWLTATSMSERSRPGTR